jgi:hypothetical protein
MQKPMSLTLGLKVRFFIEEIGMMGWLLVKFTNMLSRNGRSYTTTYCTVTFRELELVLVLLIETLRENWVESSTWSLKLYKTAKPKSYANSS